MFRRAASSRVEGKKSHRVDWLMPTVKARIEAIIVRPSVIFLSKVIA